jgi:formate dehydrogenase assembly factor FdhD
MTKRFIGGATELAGLWTVDPETRVDDRPVAVTMRTPDQDESLAVGFLATESTLRSPAA